MKWLVWRRHAGRVTAEVWHDNPPAGWPTTTGHPMHQTVIDKLKLSDADEGLFDRKAINVDELAKRYPRRNP